MVQSSWLPGTQITLVNLRRNRSSAARMSSLRSATSPATISQSSGEAGCSSSRTDLLADCPTCRSLMAQSVGSRSCVIRPMYLQVYLAALPHVENAQRASASHPERTGQREIRQQSVIEILTCPLPELVVLA